MSEKIIECVPNFSEGRDQKIIKKIKDSVLDTPGIKLLDLHSDADHNRSVLTFLGSPEAVRKAAFNLTQTAISLIDLSHHEGVHPYIGAVDVIPLIPLKGISMSETAREAQLLAEEISKKLKIPSYLYGKAALKEEHINLAQVRCDTFRKLNPDFGENFPHSTAGAVAVGARPILIAYNINLKSNDLSLAKKISSKIREKNGGLAALKAIGVPLKSRGIVQVSMNICDYKKTPIKKVFDTVKAMEVDILESEIVGIIPAAASFDNIKEYLKLKDPPHLLRI